MLQKEEKEEKDSLNIEDFFPCKIKEETLRTDIINAINIIVASTKHSKH